MRLRATLLIVVLAAAGAAGACSGISPDRTPPTSPGALDAHGSSPQPREIPPTTSPTNPPPVDRGPAPPSQPPSPPVSNGCDHTKAQWAIGEAASDALLERARVAAGAGSARFLRPNEPVTFEYLGSRLNLGLDARDLVRSVVCG
jgi:hypothetical protein